MRMIEINEMSENNNNCGIIDEALYYNFIYF